jgi:hypothetical protein
MARHETGCRQVQTTARQHLQDERVSPAGPRRLDAIERRVLREAQDRNAILEERRIPGAFVQPPRVELREMRNEGRRGRPLHADEPAQLRRERRVAEMGRTLSAHER